MTVDTRIDAALERVHAEQEAVDAKRSAFETFLERVSDITASRAQAQGVAAAGGTALRTGASQGDGCEAVRTAFAETVRPHSVDDVDGTEPLLETLRQELTDSVAAALAPASKLGFTPELKRAVLAAARNRRAEIGVMQRALKREAESLTEARETVTEITDWIVTADETPLTELGFDSLRGRHERLASHRERCSSLAAARQSFLRERTSRAADAEISHERLVPYLYGEQPVDYPVLVTIARLEDTCRECQRAVRDHLTRRA